jgi:diaminopropionate ammonia-lyase
VAARLGVAEVLVKDESSRLGLPSFKVLGASWAVCRALAKRLGSPVETFAQLAAGAAELRPLALSAATDGNHGRAVARMAALLGLGARIYVPSGTAQARIEAIAGEGAEVSVVDGGYEDAVRRSAADAGPCCLVISDTSWPGYEDVPRWVIEGYATIFWEVEDQLAEQGAERPGVVAVQMGVGALAAATVRYAWSVDPRPWLVGVEPERAACVLASVRAGRIVTLTEPQDSVMAGLNCATPSLVAWPLVSRGLDAYVAAGDERVPGAMRLLREDGLVAGETGAAGLAGLLRLVEHGSPGGVPLGPGARVLLLSTEGATDPAAYERLTGARAGDAPRA